VYVDGEDTSVTYAGVVAGIGAFSAVCVWVYTKRDYVEAA